jgi:radical SAM superfamily enzyme YgiQ (UPF0313 family)
MTNIILTTLNAKYTHSAFGLRYLYANLHELQSQAKILEFTINDQLQSIVENILFHQPKIIGIGVYIWNAREVQHVIATIKKVSPQTVIVLGGPEASYTPYRVDFSLADHIIKGEGEKAFYTLCKAIFAKEEQPREIQAQMVDLNTITLPYAYYSDEDVANRYIYVEVSRGCPYLCEFCLSSIDEKMRYVELDRFLNELEILWQRGIRNFKFVDRTFNLNIKYAMAILSFFLKKRDHYFVHFEVIPDNFPERIKTMLTQFPKGSLQLEVGIQTLNTEVADRIHRPLNLERIEQNLRFIDEQTSAHMHLDLIIGLPGETLESFGKSLNKLLSISTSEIQVGILKKLSGTTLDRHDKLYGMVYSDEPPYDILQTNVIPFLQMQKMKRFARFWDLVYNSGNFSQTTKLIFGDEAYQGFYDLSEWIYTQTLSTWQISLNRLAELIFNYLHTQKGYEKVSLAEVIVQDVSKIEGRKIPPFLREFLPKDFEVERRRLAKHAKRQTKFE